MGTKPKELLDVEQALWLLCLRMASGQDFDTLFRNFLDNPAVTAAIETPQMRGFFISGPEEPEATVAAPEEDSNQDGESEQDNAPPKTPEKSQNKGKKRSRESGSPPTRKRSTRSIQVREGTKRLSAASPAKRSTPRRSKVTAVAPNKRQSKEEQLLQFTLRSHSQFVSFSIKY